MGQFSYLGFVWQFFWCLKRPKTNPKRVGGWHIFQFCHNLPIDVSMATKLGFIVLVPDAACRCHSWIGWGGRFFRRTDRQWSRSWTASVYPWPDTNLLVHRLNVRSRHNRKWFLFCCRTSSVTRCWSKSSPKCSKVVKNEVIAVFLLIMMC